MRSSDIYQAILSAHPAPEWAVAREVPDGTGMNSHRRADAVAMNLWPSRGLEIRGFEIKVSRSDLLKELATPAKADSIGMYCQTWVLATPEGLVKATDPVPATWGILEVGEDKSHRYKRLPTLRPPTEWAEPGRQFVAAMVRGFVKELDAIRKSGDWVRAETIMDQIEEAREQGRKQAPQELQFTITGLERKVRECMAILEAIGIKEMEGKIEDASLIVKCIKFGKAMHNKWGGDMVEQAERVVRNAKDNLVKVLDAIGDLTREMPEEVE